MNIEIWYWVWYIIAGILTWMLVLPMLVNVLELLFGKDNPQPVTNGLSDESVDYGLVITAYKNAEITIPLIESALRQTYPNFHIYLMADECDLSDWTYQNEKLTVFRPEPPLRLKAKSLTYATDHYIRPHDYTVVLDADNLMHPKFLEEINRYVIAGRASVVAVQGTRTAKNLDTNFALGDAFGEFYKNHIERYATARVGSSSVISGSGMAVRTDVYRDYLHSEDILEGQKQGRAMLQEDKILQNYLLQQGYRILFAKDAIVYDEKVTTGDAVAKQRSRWLFSYFQNIPNSIGHIVGGVGRLNWNRFLFGNLTFILPLLILIGGTVIWALLGSLTVPYGYLLWVALLLFAVNIVWTMRLAKAPAAVQQALWKLPSFVWHQAKGLLTMGSKKKGFVPTQHTRKVSIDEVLPKE